MTLEELYREVTDIPKRVIGKLNWASRRLIRSARRGLGRGKHAFETVPYLGWSRTCPVCERSSRRFLSHGTPPREEAKCVHCGALERHRLAWTYLHERTDLFNGEPKNVLHFAPERCFEPRLRAALNSNYTTADLLRSNVDATIDVTDIQYSDGSFDVILCSHVLEHVPDDRKAMRELARVLSKDGWAMLMVPFDRQETYEDASIVDPDERLRAFGQADHVRRYGEDFVTRLQDAGFAVTSVRAREMFDNYSLRRFGLGGGGHRLFVAVKGYG